MALYHLVVWLVIAAIISYAGRFLPDANFQKIAQFIAGIVAVIAVFQFIAYLLGVPSKF